MNTCRWIITFIICLPLHLSATGNLIIENNDPDDAIIAVIPSLYETSGNLGPGPCFMIMPNSDPLIIDSSYNNPSGGMFIFEMDQFLNKNITEHYQAIEQCNKGEWYRKKPLYAHFVWITPDHDNITISYPKALEEEIYPTNI